MSDGMADFESIASQAEHIADAARKLLGDLQRLNAMDDTTSWRHLGQAIALICVAEQAAKDACSTLGRTHKGMWRQE